MKTAWITCLALLPALGLEASQAGIDGVGQSAATADEQAPRAIGDAGGAQSSAEEALELATKANRKDGANGVPQSKADIDNVIGASRTTIGSSTIWTVSASCKDTRDLATTGGCEYTSSNRTCYNVQLVGSGPRFNTNRSSKAAWTCSYVNEGATGGNACAVRAYVNCIDL